jgi:hypothetical protein
MMDSGEAMAKKISHETTAMFMFLGHMASDWVSC